MDRFKVFSATAFLMLTAYQGMATDRTESQDARRLNENGAVQVDLERSFVEGMAYADMRKMLIRTGWKPVPDAQCEANVVGDGHAEYCGSNPASDSCMVCKNMPEVGSCSGDGYCGMYFRTSNESLHVVAHGDMRDWNVGGDESGFVVASWDFSGRGGQR